MEAAVHRCRFVDYVPSGIVTLAIHPAGNLLAVARENGSVELWMQDTDTGAWCLTATAPGSALVAIQALLWAATKPRRAQGIDGARLLVSSLNGILYEVDWVALVLRKLADSNGGAAWALAAFPLTTTIVTAAVAHRPPKPSRVIHHGSIVAVGCEDGSVRLFKLNDNEGDGASAVTNWAAQLDYLSVCSGTDGRVLSLAWHPHLPILFAGTSAGVIKGWDVSSVTEAHLPHVAGKNTEETAAEDAGAASFAAAGPSVPLSALLGRGSTHGPLPVTRMRLESRGRNDTLVWALAVTSDLLVVAGDSLGHVTVWDGRTGTPALDTPLVRHEADVLTVTVHETPDAVTVASSGVDGRVSIARRLNAAPQPRAHGQGHGVGLEGSAPTRWVLAGSHRGHARDVRAVAFPADGSYCVSASADAHLCIISPAAIGSEQPAKVLPFGQHTHLLASTDPLSGARAGHRLLAAYQPASVDVWAIAPPPSAGAADAPVAEQDQQRNGEGGEGDEPAPAGHGGGLPAEHTLALRIAGSTLRDSAVPTANPSCLALSADGKWMAYASSTGVRLLRLHAAGRMDVVPLAVPLPPVLNNLPGVVAHLHFPPLVPRGDGRDAAVQYLVVVAQGKVYVATCQDVAAVEPAAPSSALVTGNGKRRRSDAHAQGALPAATCAHLYKLSLPHGHVEGLTARSAAALRVTPLFVTAMASCLAAPAGAAGDVTLVVATHERYVYVYHLAIRAGTLVATCPRASSLVTALVATPSFIAVAHRNLKLNGYSPADGHALPWSGTSLEQGGPPVPQPGKARHQQQDAVRHGRGGAMGRIHTLLVLADESPQIKLLATSSERLVSITIPTKDGISTAAVTAHSRFVNVLHIADGGGSPSLSAEQKAGSGKVRRKSDARVPAPHGLLVVELPWRVYTKHLALALERKRYAT